MPRRTVKAAVAASFIAFPAFAMDGTIMVEDPYARSSGPAARTAAAFMLVLNMGDRDDRLIAVSSEAAQRVELHTSLSDANGVMRMVEVEDGIVIPAGGSAELRRGGDHVMFMGLTRPFTEGETIPVVLTFEKAGDVAVEIPVDLARRPEDEAMPGHATHGAATN